MSFDPFEDIRCGDCGWVHYRELRCPPVTMRSAWLLVRLRLRATFEQAREAMLR